MSLYQLTKEAKEEATKTAVTHRVVALRERSPCDTFDIWEYDIFQEVDDDDPDLIIMRVCYPDYEKHQEIHGLNDHLFGKGRKNCVTTR